MDRREFLKTTAAAGALAAFGFSEAGAGEKPLPRRTLGRTGEKLSIIGFGGIVVMGYDQETANRLVRGAIDAGINYVDVAPSYGNGEAEEKLGPAMAGVRDKLFLAEKTARRDREGAQQELETSLRRLRTDHFDLYQLHAITTREDVEQAFAPGGAMETFIKAREKGQVRYLGFSAHSVEAATLAMQKFSFDTILFPFNWVCYQQGDFGPQVLKLAQEKGMGCLALKAMAFRPWKEGEKRDFAKCWYRPVSEEDLAGLALRFTLSEKVTAAIPPGEASLFKLAVKLARDFKPLTKAEREKLSAIAAKTTPLFRNQSV